VYHSRRKTEFEGGKLEPQTRPKPDGGTSTESPRRVLIVHHHQNPTIRGPRWIIDSDKVSHCADMFQALQRHCVGCLPPGSPFSSLRFPVLFPSQRPHLLPSSGLAREFHTNSNYTARWQRGKTEALVYVNMLHLLGSAPKTILWIWLIKPCISQQMQASW